MLLDRPCLPPWSPQLGRVPRTLDTGPPRRVPQIIFRLFPQTYPSKVLDKLEVRGSRLEAGKHRRAVAKCKPSLFSLLERARSLCFEGVTGCSNWLNFAIRFWRLEAGGSALETPEQQILPAESGVLATFHSSFDPSRIYILCTTALLRFLN